MPRSSLLAIGQVPFSTYCRNHINSCYSVFQTWQSSASFPTVATPFCLLMTSLMKSGILRTGRLLDTTHHILTLGVSFYYCQVELCSPSSVIDQLRFLAHCCYHIKCLLLPLPNVVIIYIFLHDFGSGSDSCPCPMHW
jgi:hypothetical protein